MSRIQITGGKMASANSFLKSRLSRWYLQGLARQSTSTVLATLDVLISLSDLRDGRFLSMVSLFMSSLFQQLPASTQRPAGPEPRVLLQPYSPFPFFLYFLPSTSYSVSNVLPLILYMLLQFFLPPVYGNLPER